MSLWHKLSRVRDYAGFELSDLRDAVHYFGAGLYKSPFNLEAYRKGWKDHQPYQADGADAALVERLLRAYEKAKKDERDAPPLYRMRGEWEHILEVEYARLLAALRRRDVTALKALLQNFCRNECSRGLSMSAAVFCARRRPLYRFCYVREFNESYRDWAKVRLEEFSPEKFSFPYVGNPIGMLVDGFLVSLPSFRWRHYAMKLLKLAGSRGAAVAEIGGGFGGLAYFLLKESDERVRYFNFDLPEMNVVNSYFLMKAFPDVRFALYGEPRGDSRVCILPHFDFQNLPVRSMDVIFNSNSFSEMDREMVEEYIRHICRISTRYFIHTNHDEDRYYDAAKTKKHVQLSKYRLPESEFRAIYFKQPVFYHPKYFEYLFERVP